MYYRLDWQRAPPEADLANTDACPDLGVAWTMGIAFLAPLPQPIVCPLNPARGRTMRDMFLIDIPLFSDQMLTALRNAGVDNLDVYDAEIRVPWGDVRRDYKAVNIVGLVGCADLARSEYLTNMEPPMMEFSNLVIDERRAFGLDAFRLAENSLVILVSARVQRALVGAGLAGVSLEPVAG